MKSLMIFEVLGVLLLISVSKTTEASVASSVTRAGNHNLVLCENIEQGSSSLAYSSLFTREALFLQTRTETIFWPINGLNYNPITCIKVLDQIPNDLGGYVDLTSGGIDDTSVEFVFTSKWSKRMSFKIEIYTRKQ